MRIPSSGPALRTTPLWEEGAAVRLVGFGVAAAMLLTAPIATASSSATETDDPRSESANLADARRFRSEMGFPSDLDLVTRAAHDDANYSSDLVGVPLSDSEASEVLRRSQVAYAIGEIGMTFHGDPRYGGTWLDNLGGGVGVFLFTGNPDDRWEEIAARLPPGTDFQVRSVRWSQMDLLALQEAIERDRSVLVDQMGLVSTGISTSSNSVVVGLEDPTDAVRAEFVDRYGQGLEFRADAPAEADACTSDTHCRPMKGGLEINPSLGAVGTDTRCTSGFVVRNTNGFYNMLTAGHCIEYWGGYGQTWYHDNDSYGRGRYETWVIGGTRTADVGLTTIFDHEVPTLNNQIYVGGGNVKNITSVRGLWEWPQGSPVQRYGTNSGFDSGTVYLRHVSKPSCVLDLCMTVTSQVEVSFDSRKGDSGGPMFAIAPSGGNNRLALGTHVHSDPDTATNPHGWYTPEDVGRALYQSDTGVGYEICYPLFSPCD